MVSHFFPDGKFFTPFYKQYREAINDTDVFYVYRRDKNFEKINEKNVVYESDLKTKIRNIRYVINTIRKSERVVLHSFFFSKLLFFLLPLLAPLYGQKMAWLIWGGDLGDAYKMEHENKDLWSKLRGFLRRRIIYHLGYVYSPTNDLDFLTTHYKTKNIKNAYAYYSYPVIFRDESLPQNRIMIGHSAHPSSQHIKTYELMAQYPLSEDAVVYSNLSYGYSEKQEGMDRKTYLDSVVEKGQALFGKQYMADFEFCDYDTYVKKLMQIKVAIFNNNRGQAFSNIANMLHFGTKLYMSSQNDLVDYFKSLGAVIYSIDDIDESFEEPLSDEVRLHNMAVIEKHFSNEEFNRVWTEAMHG